MNSTKLKAVWQVVIDTVWDGSSEVREYPSIDAAATYVGNWLSSSEEGFEVNCILDELDALTNRVTSWRGKIGSITMFINRGYR